MLQTDQAGSRRARPDEAHARPSKHLNQIELSRRWTISPRTLERWRWLHEGPAYMKIGGRVAYRLEDVEAYEAALDADHKLIAQSLMNASGATTVNQRSAA